MSELIFNRRANFDYEILEKYEAGLVLTGPEVKSVKNKNASLKESFITIHDNELYLTNARISPYLPAGKISGYDPTRPRKVLLRKNEIKNLIGKARTRGLTLVPVKLYTKKRLIKLEFGLGKGKREFDKRKKIQKRDEEREIGRRLKN
jgi:SsrA-binding protein